MVVYHVQGDKSMVIYHVQSDNHGYLSCSR